MIETSNLKAFSEKDVPIFICSIYLLIGLQIHLIVVFPKPFSHCHVHIDIVH